MTEHKHIFGFKLEAFVLAVISLIGISLLVFGEAWQFILGFACMIYIAGWLLFSDPKDGSIFFWKWKLKNIKKMLD